METIKLIILSITQGISELLPISSSAHLIILGRVMDIPTSTLLLTSFHIGTGLAILIFFFRKIFKQFFTKEKWVFYLKIIISVIPAAVLGILFETKIEEIMRADWIIAVSLIFWGVLMILAQRHVKMGRKAVDWESITWKQSVLMGFAQTIALIPGTSRSGVTTLAGIALGLDEYTALEYSFILGLPALLGSAVWEILKSLMNDSTFVSTYTTPENILRIAIIIIIPFVVGLIALILLKKAKKTNWLTGFGIYRIILGVAILVVAYLL